MDRNRRNILDFRDFLILRMHLRRSTKVSELSILRYPCLIQGFVRVKSWIRDDVLS